MIRWVCKFGVLLLTPLLLLTGCGSTKVVLPITDGFTCHAAVNYREMSIEGDLTCGKDGLVQMTFEQPKSLYGVTLGWDGQEMTMKLGGMSLSVVADRVPQSALLCCLARVLAAKHGDGTATDDGYMIAGDVEGIAYELVCDPVSGTPLSLSVPEEELTATFKDFQILEPTD